MTKRLTMQERIETFPQWRARSDAFFARVAEAEGDVLALADLMSEAIAMHRSTRALDKIGKDGRAMFGFEELCAIHCMDNANEAYGKARQSNRPAP